MQSIVQGCRVYRYTTYLRIDSSRWRLAVADTSPSNGDILHLLLATVPIDSDLRRIGARETKFHRATRDCSDQKAGKYTQYTATNRFRPHKC